MALHRCKRCLQEQLINRTAGVKGPPLEFCLSVKKKYYVQESQQVYVREEHKFINTHFIYQTLKQCLLYDRWASPLFDKKTEAQRG